jgi:DNA repair protein RadC
MEALSLYKGKIPKVRISYVNEVEEKERLVVGSIIDVCHVIRKAYKTHDISIEHKEALFCIYMNTLGQILSIGLISVGSVNGSLCDPKIVFQEALLLNASKIILVHNHPSGNINASFSDMELTTKIKEAGELLDITLIDSVIITKNSYNSIG